MHLVVAINDKLWELITLIVMKLVFEICIPFKGHPLYYMRIHNMCSSIEHYIETEPRSKSLCMTTVLSSVNNLLWMK